VNWGTEQVGGDEIGTARVTPLSREFQSRVDQETDHECRWGNWGGEEVGWECSGPISYRHVQGRCGQK